MLHFYRLRKQFWNVQMKITPEDVQRVAALAHLELTSEECARMEKDLTAILDYIDQLSELDTSSVQAITRTSEIAQPDCEADGGFRADEPRQCLDRESALQAAPQPGEGFFRVPKVITR
jgi:aspartyl-tRNA(Asn)/glutamyl-tRNA(Gln) amidotransferase subunit C